MFFRERDNFLATGSLIATLEYFKNLLTFTGSSECVTSNTSCLLCVSHAYGIDGCKVFTLFFQGQITSKGGAEYV